MLVLSVCRTMDTVLATTAVVAVVVQAALASAVEHLATAVRVRIFQVGLVSPQTPR